MTGGSGFIGSSLVARLRALDVALTVADLNPFPDPGVETVVGDLRDPEVRDVVVTPDLDGIVHLAAETSVLKSISNPAGIYDANVGVTAGLLELARQRGVGTFLLASTNAITGDVGFDRIHEGLPLHPLTPYGATKAACEMLLSGYAGSYGMRSASLRFTNVYGPGMSHKDSFVPRLMRAALTGEAIQIYGDGQQMRDLVHVDDAVQGVLVAWCANQAGPLIVGAGRSVTVNELVDEARRVTGQPLPADKVDPKAGEMPAVIVDIDRARRLGYAPAVSLGEGLSGVWEEFQARADRGPHPR
ncbi:MAG: NAD-dependent epimerase/dehydratase family protein [Carbonactinosporaceae bacterium]